MVYLNCPVVAIFDAKAKRLRVKAVSGEVSNLYVRCSRKQRQLLPIGYQFIIDVKLIQPKNKKPYLFAGNYIFGQLSLFLN